MRKILFTLMIAMLSNFAIVADDTQWFANAPEVYLPEMTELINSDASECNQGAEPFKQFIFNFANDPNFRKERLKGGHYIIELWESDGVNFAEFFTVCDIHKNEGGAETEIIRTWYGVTANEVCYYQQYWISEIYDGEDYGDGGNDFFRFARIDGRWYLIDILNVG